MINFPEGVATAAVADLVPYARNARTHSPEQVQQIAASIIEFGFNNPVLVDASGGIVAGHGRVMAALSLGLDTVPVVRLGHLTDEQRRKYILADNRIAENSGWDMAMLSLELGELALLGEDLTTLGFGEAQLEGLLSGLDTAGGFGAAGIGSTESAMASPETAKPAKPAKPAEAPDDFKSYGEDIETTHCCPSCGYKWSGGAGG